MKKFEKDAALKIDFFGKKYVLERLNPFTVKITPGALQTIASFRGISQHSAYMLAKQSLDLYELLLLLGLYG